MRIKKFTWALAQSIATSIVVIAVIQLLGALGEGVAGAVGWEIPAGFHGWVSVFYDDPICPPAHQSGVFRTFSVPADGRVCTSSMLRGGWTYSRYEYVSRTGERTPLVVGTPGKGGDIWPVYADLHGQRELFYVGSEAEFHESQGNTPVAGNE